LTLRKFLDKFTRLLTCSSAKSAIEISEIREESEGSSTEHRNDRETRENPRELEEEEITREQQNGIIPRIDLSVCGGWSVK
jgi:hypothetical protein